MNVDAMPSSYLGAITSIVDSTKVHIEYVGNTIIYWKSTIDRKLEVLVSRSLPRPIQPLVLRVYDTLPETLFCAAVMTEVATLPALIFWWGRMCVISMPFFNAFFQSNLGVAERGIAFSKWVQGSDNFTVAEQKIIDGFKEALENYKQQYKQFRIAVVITCTVAGIGFYCSFGNFTRLLKGVLALLVAQIAWRAEASELS